ncbi:hypothetical protein K1719_026341 [Acacia pycnantha]|nr:hypothetical protein K1719_026341 [Acacia pycnantha]
MELPEEIISEIFSRLPAKSICKFKCCSKSICKLIQGTNFALKHSQHLMIMKDSCFFIQPREYHRSFKLEFHALPGDDEKKSSGGGVSRNFLRFLTQTSSTILASSNGLLVCKKQLEGGKRQLFICNPLTESCFDIPMPNKSMQSPNSSVKFILEFNHNSEEYKLILCANYDYKIGSYTPKYGVWKATKGGLFTRSHYGNLCQSLLIFKGALIILRQPTPNSDPRIVAHQLGSDTSKLLRLPGEGFEKLLRRLDEMRIFKWGKAGSLNESLCFVTMVKRSIFTIWVLEDYESSSWSRHLTISLKDLMGLNNYSKALGFTIMNGDSLVFATSSSLYKYDLVGEKNDKKLEYISEHGFGQRVNMDFISYLPTLQPCGTGATTSFSDNFQFE